MLEFNARKFKFISERRAQAAAVSHDLGERIAELRRDINRLAAIDREARPDYPARGLSPTDKQRLTEMRADLDMLETERERVQERVAA